MSIYVVVFKGGSFKIEYKDDREDFHALISAIDILGFSKPEQDTIFKMLASVLHIGNIFFNRKQVNASLHRINNVYITSFTCD